LVALGAEIAMKSLDDGTPYLLVNILVYSAYIVYVGGDHMPGFRLFLPIIPLMALALQQISSRWWHRPSLAQTTAVYIILVVLVAAQIPAARLNPRVEDAASDVGTIVGKYIAGHWPGGSLIALHTAGSTPYYAAESRFIDMLGLNDRHIARRQVSELTLVHQELPGHSKGDGEYVLDREPDFIIVGPAQGTDIDDPWFLSDIEMAADPRFQRYYQREQVMLDREGDPVDAHGLVFTYYRRVE
jgi:hypothetical protein